MAPRGHWSPSLFGKRNQNLLHLEYISHTSALCFKSLQPTPPTHQPFSVSLVSSICRLRFGHNHFPVHAFHFGLSNTPFCLHHTTPITETSDHFLFYCSLLRHHSFHLQKQVQDEGFFPAFIIQSLLTSSHISIFKKIYRFLINSNRLL